MAALCFGGNALAAPARIRFQIDPKPYSEALLDVAQQANVTLIGAGACPGVSPRRISGALTLEEALGQLLDGAPCVARMVAPGAVEVSASPQAPAAPRIAPAPVTVSDVLITATRRVRNPRELAVAVTALPQQQLETTGAADAGEAAGQLAGVVATNLGPGRNKLLFRGLSDGAYTGRARSVVATYVDDLPVNYNAPDPDLRLVDVDRVEVARGPQGALYGAGSLAGVYRIVTQQPDLERRSAELRVSGAVTRSGAPSGAVEGYYNQPLWDNILGLRVSGYEEVQGGYLDDIPQKRKDVDRTERRGARLALRFQPSDAWSVSLTAAGQHLRSDDTHYTNPGFGLTRAVRIPEPHVNDIEWANATVRRSWGWGELTSTTGYVRHAYGSLYDATATQKEYTSIAQTSAYLERTRTRMLVEDLVLTSRGAGPLEWLAGLYASDTTVHSPTEFLAQVFGVNGPVYSDDRHDGIQELAAYGEVNYQVAPRWTLAVGGRAFSIRAHTRSHVESERFDPREVDQTTNLTGFSPKVSLQTTLASGDLAYGVISEGYRAGGVNSGGAQPLPFAQDTYRPDRLVNLELGLKMERLQRRLTLNTAAFYDLWSDIQTDQFRDAQFRDTGIPYATNAGDAVVMGVESELGFITDGGFSAQLNGRVTRTRITRVNVTFASRLVDSLPGAPAVSGGATVSYQHQVFGDWTLRLVGQLTYVGKSRLTFDSEIPTTGGYTRSRLSAELAGPRVGIQIYVSNPLNDYNDTFAFGNPFNPDRTRQITPQRPVTVGVTLSGKI